MNKCEVGIQLRIFLNIIEYRMNAKQIKEECCYVGKCCEGTGDCGYECCNASEKSIIKWCRCGFKDSVEWEIAAQDLHNHIENCHTCEKGKV